MTSPQLFAADSPDRTSSPNGTAYGPNRQSLRPDRRAGASVVNLPSYPSASDTALVGRIRSLFQRARSERQPIFNQWVKNHRVMRNRTWSGGLPAYIPQPEVPEIRPVIAARVGWITDQRPSFELVPAAQPFSPFSDFYTSLADDMKVAINACWQTYSWEAEVEKAAWDGDQYNEAYLKVVWDASLADGLGDVSLKRVDPFTIYLGPGTKSWDSANLIFEVSTISLQDLDRRFPGAASKFELSGYREQVDEMPGWNRQQGGQMPRTNPGAIAPAVTSNYGLPGQTREHIADDDAGVTLIEAWVREHSVVKDEAGIERVYDCWRCICVAGPYVLLNKRADEMYPFSRHPYERYTPEDTGSMYEQSMVELLIPSQVSINRLLSALQLNIELTGNPPFVEEARAGIQRTKITNEPGARVTINTGAKADWMKVPQVHQMMPELIKFYIGEMERIAGLTAAMRGMSQGGRIPTDVHLDMQESGFVRIRMALRNMERALCRVGQLAVATIGEFYTAPRLSSIVGPNGLKTSLALRGRHFYIPTPNGESPLRFTVMVHAGSNLPTSRQSRVAEADTLFAVGGIDRPALLDAHEWPGRQQIIERMAEMDAKGQTQTMGARQRAGRTS